MPRSEHPQWLAWGHHLTCSFLGTSRVRSIGGIESRQDAWIVACTKKTVPRKFAAPATWGTRHVHGRYTCTWASTGAPHNAAKGLARCVAHGSRLCRVTLTLFVFVFWLLTSFNAQDCGEQILASTEYAPRRPGALPGSLSAGFNLVCPGQ